MKPLACAMEFYCSLCSMKFPTGLWAAVCAHACLRWTCAREASYAHTHFAANALKHVRALSSWQKFSFPQG